jgi:hypothetical protein
VIDTIAVDSYAVADRGGVTAARARTAPGDKADPHVRNGIPNRLLHPLADGEGDIERRRSGSVSDIWHAPILNERRLSVTPQTAEQRASVPGRDAARRTARHPLNAT